MRSRLAHRLLFTVAMSNLSTIDTTDLEAVTGGLSTQTQALMTQMQTQLQTTLANQNAGSTQLMQALPLLIAARTAGTL